DHGDYRVRSSVQGRLNIVRVHRVRLGHHALSYDLAATTLDGRREGFCCPRPTLAVKANYEPADVTRLRVPLRYRRCVQARPGRHVDSFGARQEQTVIPDVQERDPGTLGSSSARSRLSLAQVSDQRLGALDKQ